MGGLEELGCAPAGAKSRAPLQFLPVVSTHPTRKRPVGSEAACTNRWGRGFFGARAVSGSMPCPAREASASSYSDKRLHAESHFSKPSFHKNCTSRATASKVTRLAPGPTGWSSTPSARSPWECTSPW